MDGAMEKFAELDTDGSGKLEENELLELANWVWTSFHPNKVCDEETKKSEAAKILKRCDKNSDGEIDKEEFVAYYNQTATAQFKFARAQAKKNKVPEEKLEDAA